jgi:signal transduction histidine kinase
MAVRIPRIAALTLAYYATGSFGLVFAHYHDNATLVWPATGLALASLILYGIRLWPGIFLGSLLLNLTFARLGGADAVGVATGNTLEAVIGTLLLVRVAHFRPTLERVRDVVAFMAIGVLGCTVVSAAIGVSTLSLTGNIGTEEPWRIGLIWWLGSAGGALILTPVLLVAANGTPRWKELFRNREFWAAGVLIVGLSTWSTSGAVTGPLGFVAIFLLFPLVVWAGTRLGSRGAVLSSFAIMLIATLWTVRAVSPFVVEGTHTSMLLLWTYGITMGATGLTLAATTGQRIRAEQLYRSEERQRLRAEREQLLVAERGRITREMHDGLGGQLVSTISMLEAGQGSTTEVVESLRRALDDMRIVIDSLDPNATDFPTSLGKLRARLEPLVRRNGIRLHWKVADVPALHAIAPEKSLHILRIIQEAVTNVVRHAAAHEAEVSLSFPDDPRGSLWLEIRDDGGGSPDASGGGGRGIRNMKTRAAAIGAELTVEEGEPGTRVRLRLPLPG